MKCLFSCWWQVCRKLGIIEVDYFGLQFSGSKGENLWLNLRNRISQQMDNLTPCRLRLRVKFFVEPHLILQEQTRYVHNNACMSNMCITKKQNGYCLRNLLLRTFHHHLWVERFLDFRSNTEQDMRKTTGRKATEDVGVWIFCVRLLEVKPFFFHTQCLMWIPCPISAISCFWSMPVLRYNSKNLGQATN